LSKDYVCNPDGTITWIEKPEDMEMAKEEFADLRPDT